MTTKARPIPAPPLAPPTSLWDRSSHGVRPCRRPRAAPRLSVAENRWPPWQRLRGCSCSRSGTRYGDSSRSATIPCACPERVADDPGRSGLRPLHRGPRPRPVRHQPNGPWYHPFHRHRPDHGRIPHHRRSRPRRPNGHDGDGGRGHRCCARCRADAAEQRLMPYRHSGRRPVALQARLQPGARRPHGRPVLPAVLHRVRVDHPAGQCRRHRSPQGPRSRCAVTVLPTGAGRSATSWEVRQGAG
jgi:hypothetical protein